ncbi:Mrp/NBP35 family ATP-binding protein [Cuniculiplasma divulgatum]|jgi:ATP-binding protein involved in chromosome partitioning|uniref:Iron-sulfur cluster carrier protein n=1 Tax=Cuniculiplasma divulgatum TaxID=1673428 RepID=A0A1N5WQI8_9ARCH|nr:Mrp/NBP35 family ATP-binding protein [Cuniculiplasma divulgatum]MCI2412060.1 Mrp/NBP35 family ATP-binding protein [Cuniculiplasma sp.]OWP55682.1 MAG: ATP-binding protein [Cuniculiplasma sp. C_DKE]WMT50064.1 MAG: Mrp/NBP35 family ATP-binding protein [Thermoplasmatales archaeon]SIM87504.1 chromosome partitioning ATPase [Cuniculiplasma divulgatum]SJK85659.1 chromosome partitioning ATPase [Cuniculiplasma divulgatum]
MTETSNGNPNYQPKGKIKINTPPPPIQTAPQASTKYKGVKHTIMVMSGKGGVGKSTFSVNIAVTLARKYRVGLIDADINGPDDPKLLGVTKEKLYTQDGGILPIDSPYGVKVISMAFLLPDEKTAVIWRGALRHKAVQQFLEDTIWDNIDYGILDFPPGTGDEALTVSQLVPQADGVVIVVTPQDLALLDAKKAINFAEQMHIKVLGIVENMSGFACPHCGEITDIFRSGGAEELAKELNIPFLGKIPIFPEIVQNGDEGIPAVEASEKVREVYEKIAEKLLNQIERKQ